MTRSLKICLDRPGFLPRNSCLILLPYMTYTSSHVTFRWVLTAVCVIVRCGGRGRKGFRKQQHDCMKLGVISGQGTAHVSSPEMFMLLTLPAEFRYSIRPIASVRIVRTSHTYLASRFRTLPGVASRSTDTSTSGRYLVSGADCCQSGHTAHAVRAQMCGWHVAYL